MDVTISAEELARRSGEPGLVAVDVRGVEAYRTATIPGAVQVNVYDYFIPQSDDTGIKALAHAARRAFEAVGLLQARTVVFFEEDTGMISPRGLWFHDFLGLSGGRVLDGGFAAWRRIGGQTRPGEGPYAAIEAAVDRARPAPKVRRELIASLDEVRSAERAGTVLLDVRRRSEFTGDFVHPCCRRAGRIPGCMHLFWEDVLRGGAYRPAEEIAAAARAAGLSPDQRVVTYCHRGARAATALYALRRAGFRNVGVFVGSWHEWAANEALPIETGA
jgi:thiosulfate/3-mercaptopyruvate sulfurtransferase